MSELLAVLVALALAFVFKEFVRAFGVPRVVGEISAGIVLGLMIMGGVFFSQATLGFFSLLANIGAIMLFFFVGLEINLRQAKKNLRQALSVSVISTFLSLFLGIYVSTTFFGLDIVAATIVGIALAVSAVALSMDFLEELGLLKTHVANIIVTAGAVDDVIEFFLIALILAVLNTAIGQSNLLFFVLQVLFFAIIVVVFKLFIVSGALRFFAREHSEASVFGGGIMLTLFMAVIAEVSGLGSFLGALIAGVVVAESLKEKAVGKARIWEAHTLIRSIHAIGFGFLVPVFFVWVGLNLNILALLASIPFMLALLFMAFFGMVAGASVAVLLNKGTLKEGILVGLGIAPKGDVELAIATLALSQGVIQQSVFAPIVGMAILTTIIAPITFKWLLKKWGHELGPSRT